MNTLIEHLKFITAVDVWFDENKLNVRLADGRELGTPLSWYPKLRDSTEAQRNNWRFIGKGLGIHWEDLNEDLSVEGLLKIG